MKIKKFKNINEKYIDVINKDELKSNIGNYKVGDYIVIDTTKISKSDDAFFLDVGDVNKLLCARIDKIINNDEFPLRIYTSKDKSTSINKDEILRYMTDKEIEIYELDKIANKYNL